MSGGANHNHHLKIILAVPESRLRRQLAELCGQFQVGFEEISGLPDLSSTNSLKNAILVFSSESVNSRKISAWLKQIKKSCPRLSLILLTSPAGALEFLKPLEDNLLDFVCPRNNLPAIFSALRSEIQRRQLKLENEYYLRNLTKLKLEQSRHIRKLLELEEIYDTTVENLMTALDLRDVETFGHSRTVSKYSQVLAEVLGLKDQPTLDHIRKGALLHDIGKIAIPDSILKKPGPLTPEEWEKIRMHPTLGYGLIKEMKLLKEVGNIILYHHEKYDGTGYPRGLKKDEIPLEARIFALADALDAITSHRPYRPEQDFLTARQEIIRNSGTQFDPVVVEAFCALDIDRWERIRFETTKLLPSFEDYHRLLARRNRQPQ
ncbi:MAG: HD-hydrolase domain [Candidatus Saccharicenans subterraneus]|uniref:HD-hydrolase domain n=1 Tax=Candidatus Saccharicenans subterraneus TaxID=2508984 RepID=A0A3E2BP90_9BACT|nr:MAG: HD-hydrolase domain [Candidatus Saccharicenans subterraneum]